MVIPASKWGKAKTASQMLAIVALIIEPRWSARSGRWGDDITWYWCWLMRADGGQRRRLLRPRAASRLLTLRRRRGRRSARDAGARASWREAATGVSSAPGGDRSGTTRRRETERLFVAVPLPDGLAARWSLAAQEALPAVPGLRLLRPEQLHVTLAFIGEVDAAQRPRRRGRWWTASRAMWGRGRAWPASCCCPRPAGAGGGAGAGRRGEACSRALFERVMGGLEAAGSCEREKRPFRPHLTIARLRDAGDGATKV